MKKLTVLHQEIRQFDAGTPTDSLVRLSLVTLLNGKQLDKSCKTPAVLNRLTSESLIDDRGCLTTKGIEEARKVIRGDR